MALKLTAIEIEQRIKNIYPDKTISLNHESLINTRTVAIFTINGKEFKIRPSELLQKKYKFKQLSGDYQGSNKVTSQYLSNKILEKTYLKHPELMNNLDLKIIEYISVHESMKIELNGKSFIIKPDSAITNGLSRKVLQLGHWRKYSVEDLNNKLKELYPNKAIVVVSKSFESVYDLVKFTVDGEKLTTSPLYLLRGNCSFKNLPGWENSLKYTKEEFKQIVLEKTYQKFPELSGTIKLEVLEYKNNKSKVELLINDKKVKLNSFYILENGLGYKHLGKNRPVHNKKTAQEVLDIIQSSRPFLSFNLNDYVDTKTLIMFTDTTYGQWSTQPRYLMLNTNARHPQAGIESRSEGQKNTVGEVQNMIKLGLEGRKGRDLIIPRDYLIIDETTYIDTQTICRFVDEEFGEFWARPNSVLYGQEHPLRSKGKSSHEQNLHLWLNSLGFKVERNKKFQGPEGKREVDILLPEENFGIEINGLYWHNEHQKTKKYHYEKRELFNSFGITLLQFNDYEWINKRENVQDMILRQLNQLPKVSALQCSLQDVDTNEAQQFIENNSLGHFSKGLVCGLRLEGELVAVLEYKVEKSRLVIYNYVPKIGLNIVEGLSFLIKQVQGSVKQIETQVDLNYYIKDFLEAGFKVKETQLNYMWTDNIEVYPLMQYTPSQARILELVKLYGAGQGILISKPL